MASKIIVNHSPGEIRIAHIRNDQVVDIYIERKSERSAVGNIFKGRVVRVLPGMQAAFVDIALERTAFLYVGDIYVPKDSDFGVDEDEPEESEASDNSEPWTEGEREQVAGSGLRRVPPSELPRIQDLLKEGQEILVQVSKAPLGTKGARLTTHITLAGRHLVYMPTVEHIGVSRKIREPEERVRLKELIEKIKPPEGGVIVRTIGEGKGLKKLKNDVSYLSKVWREISHKVTKAKAPSCIYEDLDLMVRTVRDQFTEDIDEFVVDDKAQFERIGEFVDRYLPLQKKRLKLYDKATPIFDHFGIEMEIQRALSRKVWLKSGGYIIIDQAEALTAIDVNTGRFVGRGQFEDTIFKTNMEAVKEISYQLRLRNIGGLIVVDFIDMEKLDHRERIVELLKEELKKDKAKTNVLKISDLGLVEMTRKRVRESLGRQLCEPCPYCEGRGLVRSKETVMNEIDREILREANQSLSETIMVYCHSKVAEALCGPEYKRILELENKLKKRIHIKADPNFHIEQYEVFGQDK